MKNKKKLLIAVAAMGLLAVGTAGVGTAAWFQTTAQAAFNKTGATQYAVSSTSTPATLGSFRITAKLGAPSGQVSLSDNDGATYVYNTGDVSNKLPASASTALHASIAVTYAITYEGSMTNLADVNAAWQGAVTADLILTIADHSGDGYEALSGSTTPTKASVTKVQSGEGVKLFKSEPTVGTGNYTGASSVNWTITAASLKALSFTKPDSVIVAPADQTVGTLYVAIKGVDGIAQVATTYYEVQATIA